MLSVGRAEKRPRLKISLRQERSMVHAAPAVERQQPARTVTESPYAHFERALVETWAVNANHIKHVAGRKVDIGDPQWVAELGGFGLVRGSFIPPNDLRELRLVSCYRKTLGAILSAPTNRLQKLLDDAGVKHLCGSQKQGISGRSRG